MEFELQHLAWQAMLGDAQGQHADHPVTAPAGPDAAGRGKVRRWRLLALTHRQPMRQRQKS